MVSLKKWIVCLIVFNLMGCATAPMVKQRKTVKMVRVPSTAPAEFSGVKEQLEARYADWKGTRYKMGGNDKRGVDCSGFVHRTYREIFGITIPRTTRLLAKTGKPVKKKDLRVGDLVLFKTGITLRHVGIYMGHNTFLHVSTHKGVTQSKLDNPYWRKRYWTARRVPIHGQGKQ